MAHASSADRLMFPHPPNHMTPPPVRHVWFWMAVLGCVYVLALLCFHLAHRLDNPAGLYNQPGDLLQAGIDDG